MTIMKMKSGIAAIVVLGGLFAAPVAFAATVPLPPSPSDTGIKLAQAEVIIRHDGDRMRGGDRMERRHDRMRDHMHHRDRDHVRVIRHEGRHGRDCTMVVSKHRTPDGMVTRRVKRCR